MLHCDPIVDLTICRLHSSPSLQHNLVAECLWHCAGGKIEKNEMGGACGAYGGGERCAQGSGWET